ncbi:MAG: polysaccharide deacetylase family protein [Longimicrobiales bacterium]
MCAAVVHLDLDGLRHIFRVRGWVYHGEHDPVFESGLRRALDAFAEAGVSATLFVIAEDLDDPRKRALIESAVRRGHEIASHSVTHERFARFAGDRKRREIFESRDKLAQKLGVHVEGFRAPDLSIDREGLELVAQAGYTYDTSLIAGARYAADTGIGPVPAGAYRPVAGSTLLELPLPPHGALPFPFHPSYALVLGAWYFRLGTARALNAPGPFVLLFHLIDFADPLPSALLSGAAQRLYTLSHRGGESKSERCRQMLEHVRSRFELTTTRAIVESQKPKVESHS